MLAYGQIYSDKIMENIDKERAVVDMHEVTIHNRGRSIYRVQELSRPVSGRPSGAFEMDLVNQWRDCGKFQALHYRCSHSITACSKIHNDYMTFVPP